VPRGGERGKRVSPFSLGEEGRSAIISTPSKEIGGIKKRGLL